MATMIPQSQSSPQRKKMGLKEKISGPRQAIPMRGVHRTLEREEFVRSQEGRGLCNAGAVVQW